MLILTITSYLRQSSKASKPNTNILTLLSTIPLRLEQGCNHYFNMTHLWCFLLLSRTSNIHGDHVQSIKADHADTFILPVGSKEDFSVCGVVVVGCTQRMICSYFNSIRTQKFLDTSPELLFQCMWADIWGFVPVTHSWLVMNTPLRERTPLLEHRLLTIRQWSANVHHVPRLNHIMGRLWDNVETLFFFQKGLSGNNHHMEEKKSNTWNGHQGKLTQLLNFSTIFVIMTQADQASQDTIMWFITSCPNIKGYMLLVESLVHKIGLK